MFIYHLLKPFVNLYFRYKIIYRETPKISGDVQGEVKKKEEIFSYEQKSEKVQFSFCPTF